MINNTMWRYAGTRDYIYTYFVACFTGVAAFFVIEYLFKIHIPLTYYMVAILDSAAFIIVERVIYRELMNKTVSAEARKKRKHLLIVGAGTAGAVILDEILHNPNSALDPVAFIDDSRHKFQRSISGVRVVGKTQDIERVCREYSIDTIYLAIPSATNEQRARILKECLKTNCRVKTLPYYSELVEGESFSNKIREITPEELLGRNPIDISDENILSFISGKTVVITGGGGSIGSELCRQIAAHSPGLLVIIDIYENNAYEIQQELLRNYGDSLNLKVYIASVRDYQKINFLFSKIHPDIVIHAAAHKHVPLMETSPDEAVKNNICGTYNTAKAAVENKVGKFIMISTDKAVNPTNIMGATKRVCEMIIQYFDSVSPDTSFAAVRFGNVLGSNGSVIPLFKEQIAQRKEVTVTHPDMIRYFMTIPEASQLVLTAVAMANGGEIFVLDMGDPVRIDDLARKMIRLAGLTVDKDISIRYIGLRPGEKLYEELLMNEEGLKKTPNSKIFIGKAISFDRDVFIRRLNELKAVADVPNPDKALVEAKLFEIVPTFKRYIPAADSKPQDKQSENPSTAQKVKAINNA